MKKTINLLPTEAEKFVSLYEAAHPEHERACRRFFRRTDKRLYLHIINIKYMVYLLDKEILIKMLELMQSRHGLYIQMYAGKNPRRNGASAYFGRDFLGRARIRYYEIEKKRQLNPPYKTFFHEFGHALDDCSKRGRRFYSDTFQFTQRVKKNYLRYGDSQNVYLDQVMTTETKTIHEWARVDVENYLIRTAVTLMQNNAEWISHLPTPFVQYQVIHFVVYRLFLSPDGEDKLHHLAEKTTYGKEINGLEKDYTKEIHALYQCIQKETGQKILKNVQDTIVLPKDLFGGITNNQLGGGHGNTYWFRKKRRIREVSREAFAGYFEYRATILDSVLQEMVINPHNCIPYTKAALEGMLREIFHID